MVAHFNSSWDVRVRRDDLLTLQVDGTQGSAVAGLRGCLTQHRDNTPKPVWNPDIAAADRLLRRLERSAGRQTTTTPSRRSGSCSCSHVAGEGAFRWNLLEGAKGVQLAELGLKSWKQKKWLDVPRLKA